ncbi:hypothetical protein B0T20DRAFT_103106 [Sordaria brevicollis]|uniref:Mating factor alpha n=1 Tax=Sordaria brevicollis TaxID=83679 RepID=A0AAE0U2B9_SORBR|nr:hypothetical protein B0T20DRAFT_103106 [Sordaria brevicollis]
MQLNKTLAILTLLGAAQAAAIPPVAVIGPDVEVIKGGEGEQTTDVINRVIWWKREEEDGDKQTMDMINRVAWWKREAEAEPGKEVKEGEQTTDMINRTVWWKRGGEKEDEQSTDMIDRIAWWKRDGAANQDE